MIQTKFNTLYVCEIKFSHQEIGSEIIGEMKEKIDRLEIARNFSVRPVLIHVNHRGSRRPLHRQSRWSLPLTAALRLVRVDSPRLAASSGLRLRRTLGCIPLIGVSPTVVESEFFSHIVDFGELLNPI